MGAPSSAREPLGTRPRELPLTSFSPQAAPAPRADLDLSSACGEKKKGDSVGSVSLRPPFSAPSSVTACVGSSSFCTFARLLRFALLTPRSPRLGCASRSVWPNDVEASAFPSHMNRPDRSRGLLQLRDSYAVSRDWVALTDAETSLSPSYQQRRKRAFCAFNAWCLSTFEAECSRLACSSLLLAYALRGFGLWLYAAGAPRRWPTDAIT